jgi:hypothetical protein
VNGTDDDRYFEWLYSHIGSVRNRNPARSYWDLARKLYTTPFIGWLPNDDNREEDGKCLRDEFTEQTGTVVDREWRNMDCSFLEMLIGLAQRASFESGEEPVAWFWKMMENLELRDYTDDIYEIAINEAVEEALNRVNDRTYARNGEGGLFPLNIAHKDQRKVELWYQLAAYLLEGKRVREHLPQ